MDTQTAPKTEDVQARPLMKEVLQQNKSLFQLPKVGDVVEGAVIGKESGAVYLDLGLWGTGVIYGREYYRAQDMLKKIKTGETLAAKVVELENDEGFRELSLKEAGEEKLWQRLREQQVGQEPLDVKITEANRGGLIAEVDGIPAFLPVSQLTPAHYPRIEGGDKEKILEELGKFVGETLQVRIIDLDPKQQKIIISEKAAENEAIKKTLAKYAVGDVVEGQITGVVDFGAFIKFDPLIEGLIHISELDWQLIENPHDIVSVGDKVQAKIVDISTDDRVSLSLKALKQDPWEGMENSYKEGDVVEGEVKRLNPYGALVKITEGIQGLLHISEFSSEEELREKVKDAGKYKFEILSIEPREHRLALRLKA